MGDFIKELNVIDFLGILLPGAFLLMLIGGELDIWTLLGGYWGEEGVGSTAIRVTLLLVGGYVVGSLLHEAGDLLEKMMWKHYAFDPRTYAACSTKIEEDETINVDQENLGSDSFKSRALCSLWTVLPFFVVLYGLFAQWQRVNVCCIAKVCAGVCLFIFILELFLGKKIFKNRDKLEQIRRSDGAYLAYPAEENYKIRKRMIFDGFRAMSRNLFIALTVLLVYAKCSSGSLAGLLAAVQGNRLYAAALFAVQIMLLARYWHYSYLKYKYCYEDYLNGKGNKEDAKPESGTQCASPCIVLSFGEKSVNLDPEVQPNADAKKKNLVPRMERCESCHVKDGFALKGRWRETLMPEAKELRVELGCGKGRFTAETARLNPEVLFIAIEKVPDALVVAMERAVAMELKNVFFVVGDAALAPDYFAPEEVDLIYINFCDPWPPKGQAKRRLTHRGFLDAYRKVLKAGGQVHFKTDNQPLFEFSVLEFPEAGYALSEVTRNLHENGPQGVMTDYEAKFYEQGLPINRCVGTLLPRQEE